MLRAALQIFPLLEMSFLLMSFYLFQTHLFLSVCFVLVAALFLNFSLHITVHHYVHFKVKNQFIDRFVVYTYSIFLGLPYSLYRAQHFNHHRYNNSLDDVTSTWTLKKGKTIPKNFIGYSFFWFVRKPDILFTNELIADGKLDATIKIKILLESGLIGATYTMLIWINPFFALYYLALTYVGWTLIAITNYGQHLPLEYGTPKAFTYKNKIYNFFFFNNGLHYEHHENPTLNYPELEFKNKAVIKLPHILIRLFTRKINVENEI